jgi:type II secretory pathway pseudopilin PulG
MCFYLGRCHPHAKRLYSQTATDSQKKKYSEQFNLPPNSIWYRPGENGNTNTVMGKTQFPKMFKELARIIDPGRPEADYDKCTGHGLRFYLITSMIENKVSAADIAKQNRQSSLNSQQSYASRDTAKRQANRALGARPAFAQGPSKKQATSMKPSSPVRKAAATMPSVVNRLQDQVQDNEKDRTIELLQAQIEELKKKNNKPAVGPVQMQTHAPPTAMMAPPPPMVAPPPPPPPIVAPPPNAPTYHHGQQYYQTQPPVQNFQPPAMYYDPYYQCWTTQPPARQPQPQPTVHNTHYLPTNQTPQHHTPPNPHGQQYY